MLAAQDGHEGIVMLLLARTEIQVNLTDHTGRSALRLATDRGHDAVVALLLVVPHINTTTSAPGDGHTSSSLEKPVGKVGGVDNNALYDEASCGKAVDAGGANEEGADNEGANNNNVQGGPSTSIRIAEQPRDDEEDGSQDSIDGIAPPDPLESDVVLQWMQRLRSRPIGNPSTLRPVRLGDWRPSFPDKSKGIYILHQVFQLRDLLAPHADLASR
ncbi:hypothetical protein BKA70DRAFT_1297567 [Coprinopsis sp. MPI-PUGE-AT-0042]|nr:hypothetical protein BKA70DRAFT_1297567 [Coprinopsis sp. MPI-PUGE-AT-0042]